MCSAGAFEVPFIDRDVELGVLLDYVLRGFYPVLFIYGPEGCGKTRLVRELMDRAKRSGDVVAVYVDALSTGSVEDAIEGPREVVELAAALASTASEAVGKLVARILPRLIRRAFAERVRGKRVVVVVDDVARPLGVEAIESYAKKLLDLAEWLLGQGASSTLVLATSSEASSFNLLARHNYVCLDMLWNLDREASMNLLESLNAPQHLREEIYAYTGGNPRAIIELRSLNWSLGAWLQRIEKRIKHLLEELAAKHPEELEEIVENPDAAIKHQHLRRALVEHNLLTPLIKPCLGRQLEASRELGVGDLYAWQLPAYMHVARKIATEHA